MHDIRQGDFLRCICKSLVPLAMDALQRLHETRSLFVEMTVKYCHTGFICDVAIILFRMLVHDTWLLPFNQVWQSKSA